MNRAIGNNVSSESGTTFVDDTTAKTGKSKTTVYDGLNRRKNLTDLAKQAIREKELSKAEANTIAGMDVCP